MEIQGKIVMILPLQSGVGKQSGKEWKKQEYILETNDQYPKKICFNLWGETIDRFALKQGEDVTIQVDVESREYNGRWYTEIRAWRVDRGLVSLANPIPAAPPAPAPMAGYSAPQPQRGGYDPLAGAPKVEAPTHNPYEGADDLPF